MTADAALVELLARHLYLVVMEATEDHWLLWEHLPHVNRSGYYDLAYDIANEIHDIKEA